MNKEELLYSAEEHGRRESKVALPQCGDVVEGLDRRGDGNQQGGEHEHGAQKWIHAGHKHVVSPHDEAQEANAQDGADHRGAHPSPRTQMADPQQGRHRYQGKAAGPHPETL